MINAIAGLSEPSNYSTFDLLYTTTPFLDRSGGDDGQGNATIAVYQGDDFEALEGFQGGTVTIPPATAVPEPTSLTRLAGIGMAAIGRRRASRHSSKDKLSGQG